MRTIIDYNPFADPSNPQSQLARCPAKWITHPLADGSGAVVQAFSRKFTIDRSQTIRIHVSADERYELYLDSERIGRGPERGDRSNWYFQTHDLTLAAGQHTLTARSWWLSDFGPSPYAQITVKPAFVLAAEVQDPHMLNTGFAPWTAKILTGYRHIPTGVPAPADCRVRIIGQEFPWDFERGAGDGWTSATTLDWALGPDQHSVAPTVRLLRPATLPPMMDHPIHVGKARHVQALTEVPHEELLVQAADNLTQEAIAWDNLLANQAPITIPPQTIRRVIVDLQNYYCAYTDLITTGGKGAVVRSRWAESLYLPARANNTPRQKGNRDQIEGKTFIGFGDTFEPDGGPHRLFSTLWWEAGRYLELIVSTAHQPLTIEQFSLRETRYPHVWKSQFDASDARFSDLTPILRRALEMCSNETYMDCPYYEQLMYIGDTRLETLATYAWSADDRLPRKALRMFDVSRQPTGFTQSRYPCRIEQTIPPFSAWWIGMIHDYAMWRDDPPFVRSLLPGMRAVLDAFMQCKTSDNLIAGPQGWNFMDWTAGWIMGVPPDGGTGGLSAPLNFQLAWICNQAAELEEAFGDPALAALHHQRAHAIATAAVKNFWNENRGLFADDLKHTRFSEHTQCLALLADAVDPDRRPRLIDHLFTDDRLTRTTIYFTHYLFETCAQTGRIDALFDRLNLWFDLKRRGFKTTLESPEPARFDCHGWGSHPMYHYFATILGIRPASPGFATVAIRPQLGPLQQAKGTMVHPKGVIQIDVQQSNGTLTGTIHLPAGLKGSLWANAKHNAIIGPSFVF